MYSIDRLEDIEKHMIFDDRWPGEYPQGFCSGYGEPSKIKFYPLISREVRIPTNAIISLVKGNVNFTNELENKTQTL